MLNIFIPINGQVLQERISVDNFEIKLWDASLQMKRDFKAIQEGNIKLKNNSDIYQLKNSSVKYMLSQSYLDYKVAFFTIF